MSKQKWTKLYHGKEEKKKPPELLIMLLQALHSKQCLTGKVQRLKKKKEKKVLQTKPEWLKNWKSLELYFSVGCNVAAIETILGLKNWKLVHLTGSHTIRKILRRKNSSSSSKRINMEMWIMKFLIPSFI